MARLSVNGFFSKQFSSIANNSSLPTNKLSTFEFITGAIIKLRKTLEPKRIHRHNEISILMMKLWAFPISKPLHILFKSCLKKKCFLNEGRRKINVPVYKKGDKELIDNYQPVLLFFFCTKIFENIIFKFFLEYLDTNKLRNNNQSEFHPGDSCVH